MSGSSRRPKTASFSSSTALVRESFSHLRSFLHKYSPSRPFSFGTVRLRPLRRTKWGIELPRREKKRKIFSSETFSERILLLMSSHDPPGVDPHQASAAHTHMIEEISELLLPACRLGQEPRPDQSSQIQQDAATPRGRGRPQQVGGTQLWSSLLLCALQGMHS